MCEIWSLLLSIWARIRTFVITFSYTKTTSRWERTIPTIPVWNCSIHWGLFSPSSMSLATLLFKMKMECRHRAQERSKDNFKQWSTLGHRSSGNHVACEWKAEQTQLLLHTFNVVCVRTCTRVDFLACVQWVCLCDVGPQRRMKDVCGSLRQP